MPTLIALIAADTLAQNIYFKNVLNSTVVFKSRGSDVKWCWRYYYVVYAFNVVEFSFYVVTWLYVVTARA